MACIILILHLLLRMAGDLGQALSAVGSFVGPRLVHHKHDGAVLAMVFFYVIYKLLVYLYYSRTISTDLLDSLVSKDRLDRLPNAEVYRSRRLGWTWVFGDDMVTGGKDPARPGVARSFTIDHPRKRVALKYGNATIELLAKAEAFWTTGAVAVDTIATPSPPISRTELKVMDEDGILAAFWVRLLEKSGGGDGEPSDGPGDVDFDSNIDARESFSAPPEMEKTKLPLPPPPPQACPSIVAEAVAVDTTTPSPPISPNDLDIEEEDRMLTAFFMRFLDEPGTTEQEEGTEGDGEPFGFQGAVPVDLDSNHDAEESLSVVPILALPSPLLPTKEQQPALPPQGAAKRRRSKRIAAVQGPLRRSERIAKRPHVSYKGMC